MTGSGLEPHLEHLALRRGGGASFGQARLTDLQRVAIVLQGAALLAHAEHGGWILGPDGAAETAWADAEIMPEGLLRIPRLKPGLAKDMPQVTLAQLLRLVFRSPGEIVGRGAGCRAARQLLDLWRQELIPSSADLAVAQTFDAAPYLWDPEFAMARTALMARHFEAGRERLWLVGPGPARRRFLSQIGDLDGLQRLIVADSARDRWEGIGQGTDADELFAAGRWRRAAAIWRRQARKSGAENLAFAEALCASGQYSEALAALRRRQGVAARLLRLRCQLALGEHNAAQRGLRQLEREREQLSPEQTVDLAEVALKLLGHRQAFGEVRTWVSRLLDLQQDEVVKHETRARALIAVAWSSWDVQDPEAMGRHLEAARELINTRDEDRVVEAFWWQAQGLYFDLLGNSGEAVRCVAKALNLGRRGIWRERAGRLWNDMAYTRARHGDLHGAEKACRHAFRLLSRCQGPAHVILGLGNLAELRLRRGRIEGVQEALERSIRANRRAANRRGVMLDLELWARLELVQGRAVAALARCSEARQQVAPDASVSEVIELLAARALGWLGRAADAEACLLGLGSVSFYELEAEERPAVWALAGRWDKALEVAQGGPWYELWSALSVAKHPTLEAWRQLDSLEDYRAARLIVDCELVLPGVTPVHRLRQASGVLRRLSAVELADRIEAHSPSPWQGLSQYLQDGSVQPSAIEDLFVQAGFEAVDLRWQGLNEQRHEHSQRQLIDGAGGPCELTKVVAEGTLVLRSNQSDAVLEALFELVARDLALQPSALQASGEADEAASEMRSTARLDGIIGSCEALTMAVQRLDLLAASPLPVLIFGESGTGKELMAKRVHRMSGRTGSFVALNCAALTETLVGSELFGHVRGAFTGADQNRVGLFESAVGGTLFLDEIGDLPSNIQATLLRALQEGKIRRIGESFDRPVDVRIVTATHRDLRAMVAAGEFREDLFHRLGAADVHLPPLRDRGRDVLELARFFLNRIPAASPDLAKNVEQRLLAHDWPGNIRELQNVMQVASALAGGKAVAPQHLSLPQSHGPVDDDPFGSKGFHYLVNEYRKKIITDALRRANGNQSAAARILGLTRQALSYSINKLGIEWQQ